MVCTCTCACSLFSTILKSPISSPRNTASMRPLFFNSSPGPSAWLGGLASTGNSPVSWPRARAHGAVKDAASRLALLWKELGKHTRAHKKHKWSSLPRFVINGRLVSERINTHIKCALFLIQHYKLKPHRHRDEVKLLCFKAYHKYYITNFSLNVNPAANVEPIWEIFKLESIIMQ